jgi:hypothetical protein
MDETTQTEQAEAKMFATGENGVKSTERLVVEAVVLAAVFVGAKALITKAVKIRRVRKTKQDEQ